MTNIIFMDAEFNGLRSDGTEFLSIALTKPTGEELYIEFHLPDRLDPWVEDNVYPYLKDKKTEIDTAKTQIEKFVGNEKPFMLADVPAFDWMGICGIFGVFDHPFHYIPIDFASILFAKGIDPDIDRFELAKSKGIDVRSFKKHHALHDCRVLKETYSKL